MEAIVTLLGPNTRAAVINPGPSDCSQALDVRAVAGGVVVLVVAVDIAEYFDSG